GIEVGLLPNGSRLCLSRVTSRRKAIQRRTRLLDVFVVPERLVVGHRLAPICESERGVDPLSLSEGGDGVVVLEAVQQQHAAHERRLCRRGSGVGERDAAERRCLGPQRSEREYEETKPTN